MSVLVQKINSETDKNFYFFTKGADSSMLGKMELNSEDGNKIQSI